MAKLDLDFVLIDESVVDRGYRCLLSGAELSDFLANPIMLFMHNRADKYANSVNLPIGRWYDVRVEDGKLKAKPDFDDKDAFAMQVQQKVQDGYLNACSIWVNPKAASMEPMLLLEGQELPTITRWGIRECSIVDIPGCAGAVALRNSSGRDVEGSADVETYLQKFLPKQKTGMNTKEVALKLGLADSATDEQVNQKLDALKLGADAVNDLKLAKDKAENDLKELKLAQDRQKVTDLVAGAINARKIPATEKEKWEKLAGADFDSTKAVLEGMKGFEGIDTRNSAGNLDEAGAAELADLMKLSGHDLWMKGKLARVKDLNEASYKLKYKEAFGVEAK